MNQLSGLNAAQMHAAINGLSSKNFNKFAVRALNGVARKAHTKSGRITSRRMGIKVGAAKNEIKVKKANQSKHESEIVATFRPLSLKRFAPRQTKKGVTAKAWGRRKLYRGAFINKTKMHGHVFRRSTKKSLPVRRLWGPDVPRTLASQSVQKYVLRHARRDMERSVRREYRRIEYEIKTA